MMRDASWHDGVWPLDLPARAVLRLADKTLIRWAAFDPDWYLATYKDASRADPLQYYLATGQGLGHSPNRMFDEQWHRATYPSIAAGIADGRFASAFDAYCRSGCLDRSAHWLFDELAYRDRYPDLTNEILAEAGLANGYDHYLRHGVEEQRIGHLLFDPAVYLDNFDPRDADAIRETGVFQHYLKRIETAEPDLRTSVYFDPDWYLRRYPDVAEAIAARRWKCALHHYLCNDRPTAFDPNAHFSEAFYLQRDPGLLEVIEARHFRNGYAHFLRFGARELRPPSAAIDLAWYAGQPAVRADIDQGRVPNAFAHWLTIGGAPPVAPDEQRLTDAQAAIMAQRMDAAVLPLTARFGCSFRCAEPPALSVVVLPRDGFDTTLATLASLRADTPRDMQLVIIDRGSLDETRSIEAYVDGATVVRFADDIGWAAAADTGRQMAQAPFVLFLAGSARLAFGSVERALRRMDSDPTIGAVGAMVVRPCGLIGQAGGLLWNDGGTHDYQGGASPLVPEANFVRTVDYCSPAFLMVRRDLLDELEGFDRDCAPGYAAIDLCLRIGAAGFRVVYDPGIRVFHDTEPDRPAGPGPHFLEKHKALLAGRYPPGGPVQAFARHAGPRPHRLLFLEDTVPLRRAGSGFVRSNDLVRVMDRLGYAVTVYPVNGFDQDLGPVFQDMPDTVEVMHTHGLEQLRDFLAGRPRYYDTIWIARAHNLDFAAPVLKRLAAAGVPGARIVLDTEAVAPAREAIQARLNGQDYDLDAAMRRFVRNMGMCEAVLAVTQDEADILRDHAAPGVAVVGHMVRPRSTPRGFQERAGLLFVGAIHKQDSPNLDSLVWFVDAVLPLIEKALGWQTRLTVAGYTAPGVSLDRFERHPRVTLRGPVADLTPLYDAHRVFVAPTRFAAGAPYKVFEAASRGLPVVATDLLCTQLGWTAGEDILAAPPDDPAAFADAVLALYGDAALWHGVRGSALCRLSRENNEARFMRAVAKVVSGGNLDESK